MDGGAGVPAVQPSGGNLVCTLRVVRDSRGAARNLMISSAELRDADQGHLAALVGRHLADVLPEAAEDVLHRIGAVDLGRSERIAGRDLPEPVRALTPSPPGTRTCGA